MTSSQKRLLIVDDDIDLCQMLVQALAPLGLYIGKAHTAEEGMHQLRDHVYDVVLLDLGLPDQSGLEVLRGSQHSQARFIIITADSTPGTVVDAVRARAFDYITKPFSIETVMSAVTRALESAFNSEIEIYSAKPEWFELSLPCTRDCAERIENFMRQMKVDLPEDLRDTVISAFRELLMNAVEWGGGLDPDRRVRVSCLRTSRMIQYRISDPGPGFRFENLTHAAIGHPDEGPMAHLSERETRGMRPGGLGLVMVKAMADELLYNEEQNEVVLIKYLD
jgi:ActR/RegA family two-component response regulator/anti-sigma regulatory factor (Ser/Thr protein kinase)